MFSKQFLLSASLLTRRLHTFSSAAARELADKMPQRKCAIVPTVMLHSVSCWKLNYLYFGTIFRGCLMYFSEWKSRANRNLEFIFVFTILNVIRYIKCFICIESLYSTLSGDIKTIFVECTILKWRGCKNQWVFFKMASSAENKRNSTKLAKKTIYSLFLFSYWRSISQHIKVIQKPVQRWNSELYFCFYSLDVHKLVFFIGSS